MGGLSLKNLPEDKKTRRYHKDEYFNLSEELLPKIKEIFNTDISLVMSYHNKETFGDMDILILNKGYDNIPKLIQELEPSEINGNGNVYSFDYKNLQIDLIMTDPENWEASNIFFQWGDLGNLMGKLFNSYGNMDNFILKYGFDGMKIKMIYNGYSKYLSLTKDNKKAFEFLGLDFERHKEGFNDQFEMFDYIIGSKYFSYDIFQWENLTSVNKNRNKRRPVFIEFLKYIESHKNIITYDEKNEIYLENLSRFFNINIKEEYQMLVDKVEYDKSISDKFGGKYIMESFNLESGKELGKMMLNFKMEIESNNGDYNDFINNHSREELKSMFKRLNNL